MGGMGVPAWHVALVEMGAAAAPAMKVAVCK